MLEGQWLGEDQGTNPGSLWVELDKIDGEIKGCGMRMEAEPGIPGTLVEVTLEDKAEEQTIEVPTYPLDTTRGVVLSHEQAKRDFPDSIPAITATMTISLLDRDTLQVYWKSDVETEGIACLSKAKLGQDSRIAAHAHVRSWEHSSEKCSNPITKTVCSAGRASHGRFKHRFTGATEAISTATSTRTRPNSIAV